MRDFLIVENVRKTFGRVDAVRGVSFSHASGATLGIVGESGCGKSTLARMLLHLAAPTEGRVLVDGDVLGTLSPSALRRKRRGMQMVFQDPQASLDPRMRVGALLEEPLVIHRAGNRAERDRRSAELCALVGLDGDARARFPHEFSGGQRQRISIARALALSPALLVLDEPVSALDVSIQAQILNLLVALRERLGLTYVFISHDLAVIRHVSDTVAVMYLGRIVELAPVDALFAAPAHPYTRALLAAVPDADAPPPIGDAPDPAHPPAGCAFRPRCPHAMDICRTDPPDVALGEAHRVRCWLHATAS